MILAFVLFAALQLQRAVEDLKAGRLREAETALAQMVAQQPDSADAQFYLGIVRYQSGRAAEALPPLQRAVELAPKHAAAWKALGLAHSALGDFAAAEQPFRTACDADPKNELACYYFGRNQQAQNRFETAAAAFRRALWHERGANLWLVWRGLALALEAQGEATESERAFAEALKRMPAAVRPEEDPRVDYGVFLFRQGRAEEALRPLEAAAAGSPNARFQLARVLVSLGKLEPAAKQLEAAVAADPKHAAAHLLLGQVYLRLGRKQEAERHLREFR